MSSIANLSRIKLVVADQHPTFLHLLRTAAEGLGFRQTWSARSKAEIAALIVDLKIDILITERRLADGDGLDIVRWLRSEHSPSRFIPIIMMSNIANRAMINEARDAGVNEFLIKPISPRDLFARIATLIDRPRAFVRTKTYFGPDRRRRESPFAGLDRRMIVPMRGAA